MAEALPRRQPVSATLAYNIREREREREREEKHSSPQHGDLARPQEVPSGAKEPWYAVLKCRRLKWMMRKNTTHGLPARSPFMLASSGVPPRCATDCR